METVHNKIKGFLKLGAVGAVAVPVSHLAMIFCHLAQSLSRRSNREVELARQVPQGQNMTSSQKKRGVAWDNDDVNVTTMGE